VSGEKLMEEGEIQIQGVSDDGWARQYVRPHVREQPARTVAARWERAVRRRCKKRRRRCKRRKRWGGVGIDVAKKGVRCVRHYKSWVGGEWAKVSSESEAESISSSEEAGISSQSWAASWRRLGDVRNDIRRSSGVSGRRPSVTTCPWRGFGANGKTMLNKAE
jgi:hypothetical protein